VEAFHVDASHGHNLRALAGDVDRMIAGLNDAGLTVKPTSRLAEYRGELANAVPSTTPPSAHQMKRWPLLIEVADLLMIVEELSSHRLFTAGSAGCVRY
jgi:hypothetical protein